VTATVTAAGLWSSNCA